MAVMTVLVAEKDDSWCLHLQNAKSACEVRLDIRDYMVDRRDSDDGPESEGEEPGAIIIVGRLLLPLSRTLDVWSVGREER